MHAQARAFIAGYSRAPAATVGSVVVRNMGTGKQVEAVDTARIHFQPIPEEVVAQLVEEGLVFRCAGGLMIEHPLVEPLITRIEGTPDSVMGLPRRWCCRGCCRPQSPRTLHRSLCFVCLAIPYMTMHSLHDQ